MKTIGYEIEYFIPIENLQEYSRLYKNPLKDNFGFDNGFNVMIGEYRSNVFNSTNEILEDYNKFKEIIDNYEPEFIPEIGYYTYGIHISFDYYSKLKLLLLFFWIYFLRHPIVCFWRLLRIDWFRRHTERLEFRLIPTLPNDKLFLKFVSYL